MSHTQSGFVRVTHEAQPTAGMIFFCLMRILVRKKGNEKKTKEKKRKEKRRKEKKVNLDEIGWNYHPDANTEQYLECSRI